MKLVCINCPKGCHMEVEQVDGQITVEGNSCPRGAAYATSELTNPVRTLTTTVGIESLSDERLPVISSVPIPKGMMMEAIKALKGIRVKAPVMMNEVIVSDILGLKADIIASKTIER